MKRERVTFANILIAVGFNRTKVVKALRIPFAHEINIAAVAIDRHEANLIYDAFEKVSVELPGQFFQPEKTLIPNFDHVESLVFNDRIGNWSIDRSRIVIKYSDGSYLSLYFGEKASGPQTDSVRPMIHRCTIPPARGWPPLKTFNPQYLVEAD